MTWEVKPYIMDLRSTNKTKIAGEVLEPARYYELKHLDILQFAASTREYVVMKSKLGRPPS